MGVLVALPAQLGYSALFGVVFAESVGLPVPGETALLGAGVLAGAGQLALPAVIAVAATAAILGDNLGYAIGRRGGRRLLLRPGPFVGWRHRVLHRAERFFARYGEAAVFLARWVPVARYMTPLTAGAAAMPWRRFLAFNVAGAIAWCTSLTLVAALLGPAAAATISGLGLLMTAAGLMAAGLRALARPRSVTAVHAPLPDATPGFGSTAA
jgi:membrane protein DedA with SNARE-associated domain